MAVEHLVSSPEETVPLPPLSHLLATFQTRTGGFEVCLRLCDFGARKGDLKMDAASAAGFLTL